MTMNKIMEAKIEPYVPRYLDEVDMIPREIEKWEKISALAAIRRGLVKSISFITP